jgi:hypothetical protein
VKEGAKVLCIDNDSPLKSALSEGDVILTEKKATTCRIQCVAYAFGLRY